MRIIVADCSAEYSGRLNAFLPLAKRVLLIKADNSLLISDDVAGVIYRVSYDPAGLPNTELTLRPALATSAGRSSFRCRR